MGSGLLYVEYDMTIYELIFTRFYHPHESGENLWKWQQLSNLGDKHAPVDLTILSVLFRDGSICAGSYSGQQPTENHREHEDYKNGIPR